MLSVSLESLVSLVQRSRQTHRSKFYTENVKVLVESMTVTRNKFAHKGASIVETSVYSWYPVRKVLNMNIIYISLNVEKLLCMCYMFVFSSL